MHLNNDYRRYGDIEIHKLFSVEKISDDALFLQTHSTIKNEIDQIKTILDSDKESEVLLSSRCKECPFKDYCQRDLPTPNVLMLADNSDGDKYERLNSGIVTYNDLLISDIKLSTFQKFK